MFVVEGLSIISIIAVVVIYLLVRGWWRRADGNDSRRLLETKSAKALSIIEKWEEQVGPPTDKLWLPDGIPRFSQQGEKPTEELWRAVAVMYTMVAVAPHEFKPFFPPAPPETHERLAGIFGRLGVPELAGAPWLTRRSSYLGVPDRIWKTPAFQETYLEMFGQARAWAVSRGWR